MKIAKECILASLAWVVVVAGGLAAGQQMPVLQQPGAYAQLEPGIIAHEQLTPVRANGPEGVFGSGPALGMAPDGTMPPGAGPAGPCCGKCGRGSDCPPLMYVNQGMRFLGRTRANEVLITEQLIPGLPFLLPAMTNKEPDFTFAPGYTLTLGRYLGRDAANRDEFLEFTYWGLNEWNASAAFTGTRQVERFQDGSAITFGTLFTQFAPEPALFNSPVGGFNRADRHDISYTSNINNFELNIRFSPRSRPDRLELQPSGKWERTCQPGRYFSFLFGARYAIINEAFHFNSSGIIDTFDSTGALTGSFNTSGSYGVTTHNNLLGLQGGAELAFRRCRADFGVRGKVGPFVNIADQSSVIASVNAPNDVFAQVALDELHNASMNQAAVIGEVGFFADYRLRPNIIIHGGWDFMWIAGLALAAEQPNFQVTLPNEIVSTGAITYQGATLQLEFNW